MYDKARSDVNEVLKIEPNNKKAKVRQQTQNINYMKQIINFKKLYETDTSDKF